MNSKDYLSQTVRSTLPALENYIQSSLEAKGKVLEQHSFNDIIKDLDLITWIRKGGLGGQTAGEFLVKYLKHTQHLHHPGYIGHQVATPHPAGAVASLIDGAINNPMGIYEMGPGAATMEILVIHWMLEKMGWLTSDQLLDFDWHPGKPAGVLTHGGSLANLTCLLGARAAVAPEAWQNGTPDDLVILASEAAHYCIERSAGMLGMGTKAIVHLPVHPDDTIETGQLEEILLAQLNKGKRIMAIIGNACVTATGAYDDLETIGQFARKHNIWFHVDGAHGATALLSDKHKHKMKGLQYADSMIWDAHKMLRTPALCAAVLFKDFRFMASVFRQQGSYIFHDKGKIGMDLLAYTLECTKSGLGPKLFWVLAAEGEEGATHYLESQYQKATDFHLYLEAQEDFSCLCPPQSNIVCFRYKEEDQLQIRNKIVESGKHYITYSQIQGKDYLRLVVMNPATNLETLMALIEQIRTLKS